MSIAEIYHGVNDIYSTHDTFRIRNVNTLEDYLTLDGWDWRWDRTKNNWPKRVTAVALDDDRKKVRLDASLTCYVLLSPAEELNMYRATPGMAIVDILADSYKDAD